MISNQASSVNKDELKKLEKVLFYNPYAEWYTRGYFDEKSYAEAIGILERASIEEISTVINGANYWNNLDYISMKSQTLFEKACMAKVIYARREVMALLEQYSQGKIVEYLAGKRAEDAFSLCIFLKNADKILPEGLDTSHVETCVSLLEGYLNKIGSPQHAMYVSYEDIKDAAYNCDYYNMASVDEDAVCEYLISEQDARNKFSAAVLNAGAGLRELATTERLENKVLMAVDFAVNYAKTKGFVYDDALEPFISDFLDTEILDSQILGTPVRTVIRETAPYVYFHFCEKYNLPLGSYKDKGDIVKIHRLTEFLQQEIESKQSTPKQSSTPNAK